MNNSTNNPKVINTIGNVAIMKEPTAPKSKQYIADEEKFRISFVGAVCDEEEINQALSDNSSIPKLIATSVEVYYNKVTSAYTIVINGVEVNGLEKEISSVKTFLKFRGHLHEIEEMSNGVEFCEGDISVMPLYAEINFMIGICETILENSRKVNKIEMHRDLETATIECLKETIKMYLLA